jgi:hypothetical protein
MEQIMRFQLLDILPHIRNRVTGGLVGRGEEARR